MSGITESQAENCGNLRLYFAPMEGITEYRFREIHHHYFPEPDRYFTPFVSANHTRKFQNREKRDVLPENNRDIAVVPQILAGGADEFLWAVRELALLGYREVNLNLGCPSAQVVSKRKGSGFLAFPDRLDEFLDRVFERAENDGILKNVRISVKTRIGFRSAEEHVRLMEIFNSYPISELIIHARLAKDMYRGAADVETFGSMLSMSVHPVCYNGDVRNIEDARNIAERFRDSERLSALMIGRGAVRDPAIFREIRRAPEGKLQPEEFRAYLDQLYRCYRSEFSGDINVLHKMKEFWTYFGDLFEDCGVQYRQIIRADDLPNYRIAAERILRECRMK